MNAADPPHPNDTAIRALSDATLSAGFGVVWLVGAGPGDPGLITVEGARRLREAQVVIYDALANATLLDLAPLDAQRIDVGKRAGHHKKTQDEINALLVEHARAGRRVVRLKGGDPYVFGRGAEEAAYCAKHGVACVVVPGVTSGIAALTTAGIPVTHRGISASVTFITAHEAPSAAGNPLDYRALAALVAGGGTVCAYMGVGRLSAIAAALLAHDLPGETPAAVVQWGTLPTQRVARGTLDTIAGEVQRIGVGSPAIVVVGAVAGLDEPGLRFFDDPKLRPLFGRTVVVTRTRSQQSELSEQLTAWGANVLEAPTIRVEPTRDPGRLRETVGRFLGENDGEADLLLTSANAVVAFGEALDAAGLDARALAGVRIGVVGAVTAAALRARLGVVADVTPEFASGRALAERLIELGGGSLAGRRVLLPRADTATSELPTLLRAAGARVDEVEAYRVVPVASLPPDVAEAFAAGTVDWVTFTSSSTARNLVALLGPDAAARLARCRLASIGPVTTQALRDLNLSPAVEAKAASILALAQAIATATATATAR